MDISKIFFLMDIIVNCKKPVQLLDKTKEHIDEKPNQAKEIAIHFRNDIDTWFKKILLKSTIILIFLIILAIYLYNLKNSMFWISLAFVCYVIVYIIDKYQNKYEIKKKLVNEIEEYANKNGIYYENVFGY